MAAACHWHAASGSASDHGERRQLRLRLPRARTAIAVAGCTWPSSGERNTQRYGAARRCKCTRTPPPRRARRHCTCRWRWRWDRRARSGSEFHLGRPRRTRCVRRRSPSPVAAARSSSFDVGGRPRSHSPGRATLSTSGVHCAFVPRKTFCVIETRTQYGE